jgi:GAF domain-containing protein
MTVDIEFLHPLKGEVPPPSEREQERLDGLCECLRSAESLDEAFDLLGTELAKDLPFDRLALAVLTDGGQQLRALRVQSTHAMRWGEGESRPLLGSSLEPMIREHAVRIIHDLKGYQNLRPSSLSTKRLIEEGMRSSLTIPIYQDDQPLGVLFVSSAEPDAYQGTHAGLLATLSPALNEAFSRLLASPSLV